ncbi:MAG: hypothetical protein CM15mP10_1700 [Actinomycetota bacterium]|nr:MAG: hypothetical protein CM15mP10_1700 [Actinomycetota bacterium]
MVSGGNASSLPLVGGKPEPTIKELSSPGRRASKFPKLDVPEVKINHESLKKEKARLPGKYLSMIWLCKFSQRVAKKPFSVDPGFIHLGSRKKNNQRVFRFYCLDLRFAKWDPQCLKNLTRGEKGLLQIGKIPGENWVWMMLVFKTPRFGSGELTGLNN